ncbi:PLP-dependent transferase [Capnocytophaga catalasegens]|nr:PLP-dependent transferase [Capnocytophaga catalasegens]
MKQKLYWARDTMVIVNQWQSCINMALTFRIKEYVKYQEFEYARITNPTRKKCETLIAKLENGKYGFGFPL